MYESSPTNDSNAIMQMLQYRDIDQEVAEAALSKISRHMDYLTQEQVIVSLADHQLSDDTRSAIACKLLEYQKPLRFVPGKPVFPVLNDVYRIETKPDLGMFVGPRSWLLFHLLQIEDLEWLHCPPSEWDLYAGYQKFQLYVRKTHCVNDPAERAIKHFQVCHY